MAYVWFRCIEILDGLLHRIPLPFGRGRHMVCCYYERLLTGEDVR